MSIEIDYRGQFGNLIYQYVYARMLGIKNDLYLKTPFPAQDILRTTRHPQGRVFKEPVRIIYDDIKHGFFAKECFEKILPPARYIIKGYCIRYFDYGKHEKLIKSFFNLKKIRKNKKDLVMNVRLGDYASCRGGIIIHPSWYLKILEKETFGKLYIVGSRLGEPYLQYFEKYKPVIVPNTDKTGRDFHFLRKFDKIICANSSYSAWAAFFSEASRIYVFRHKDEPYSQGSAAGDEDRPIGFYPKYSEMIDGEYFKDYKPITYYRKIDYNKYSGFKNK